MTYSIKNLIHVIAIVCFSTLLVSRCEKTRQNPAILIHPIEISPKNQTYAASSSEIISQRKITEKIAVRNSFASIPDLLHHIANDPANTSLEGSLTGNRLELLEGLLDGRMATASPLQLSWFRGIDRRPHFTQSVNHKSEAHSGQLLAYFASFGVPSTRSVTFEQDSATVGEFIRSLQEDFHLEGELEWKAIALARYAPTRLSWKNRWGKTFNFDGIAGALLERDIFYGSCRGTHVLQALAIMYRVDKSVPLFSNLMRNSVRNRLVFSSIRLQTTQRPAGYWGPDWHTPHPNIIDYEADSEIFKKADLALVTGHHLEWLDLLREDITFPEKSHRKAVMWCLAELEASSQGEITNNFCAMSHCLRAVTRNYRMNTHDMKGN